MNFPGIRAYQNGPPIGSKSKKYDAAHVHQNSHTYSEKIIVKKLRNTNYNIKCDRF